MATIKINSTVMRDKASSFKTVANSIKTFTAEMTTEIESLKSVWEGEAGETTVNKFKGLADNFEEIYTTINSYANFLEEAAAAYDNVENANVQGAQGQQS
ncbi:MAG: WXG100 family type VII secretion target [Ruminococcaceae bacterium]|nr:WXG100 family type VII secretion target [Oscillospiraceae bacterium]